MSHVLSELEAKGRILASRVRPRLRRAAAQTAQSPEDAPIPTVRPEVADPSIQMLSSLAELEGKLREADEAWAISDDAMRKVFRSFTWAPPTDIPTDPTSQEYADRQFEIYRLISERPHYRIENERSDFPTDANRPFPYYTESSETVGHQLMAIGFIIKTMGLPAGSSILELGPGWGNTTIELARMGYDVTAIDIDPAFVDLISERADKFSLSVDSRRGTFLEIDQLDRTFDAVLFFECFHHCSDHRELVRKLATVIEPGGKVFFAAEPITDSFPVPWGVRTDGESLWAIRRNGWLELGFQESYFVRMLGHLGWIVDKHVTASTHLGVVFEARRANGVYELSTFALPPDEDATWAEPDGPGVKQRYSTGCTVLSLERERTCTSILIEAVNPCPNELPYRVRHGREDVSGVAPAGQEFAIRLPYDRLANSLVIEASEWRPADVLQSDDARCIGLGVRTITLV